MNIQALYSGRRIDTPDPEKSNRIMDENLVADTMKNAIEKYGTFEIFNSDQGSRYTTPDYPDNL